MGNITLNQDLWKYKWIYEGFKKKKVFFSCLYGSGWYRVGAPATYAYTHTGDTRLYLSAEYAESHIGFQAILLQTIVNVATYIGKYFHMKKKYLQIQVLKSSLPQWPARWFLVDRCHNHLPSIHLSPFPVCHVLPVLYSLSLRACHATSSDLVAHSVPKPSKLPQARARKERKQGRHCSQQWANIGPPTAHCTAIL